MAMIPDEREFERLAAAGYNLIPLCREIPADLETPVSAFLKVASEQDYAFLLESVSGGEKWARYSFIGAEPSKIIRARDDRLQIINRDGKAEVRTGVDPFTDLTREVGRYRAPEMSNLPRFFGGAVGYVAYDMVRRFERLSAAPPDDIGTPDLCLMLTDWVMIFDNVRQTIKIVANVALEDYPSPRAGWRDGLARIERVARRLAGVAPRPGLSSIPPSENEPSLLRSNLTREQYLEMVERARNYIRVGDAIEVAVSQRFEFALTAHPLNLYRSLRAIKPSPYLFYLKLGDHTLAGASPEVTVRVEGREVTVRPIAGARARGATDAEDRVAERELVADIRKRAEHVMLVDMGRNDVGKVARTGSVEVTELMAVERFFHGMHLVSNVRGLLRDGVNAFDAFRATFPQGAVSGAPRLRAIEIIDEIEPARRGTYGGAVGYFSFTGNADTAILLDTMLIKDGRVYLQAGGGVVVDSKAEVEYEESLNKARTIMQVIRGARALEQAAATGD
jgi:anthranilate synthase component 1